MLWLEPTLVPSSASSLCIVPSMFHDRHKNATLIRRPDPRHDSMAGSIRVHRGLPRSRYWPTLGHKQDEFDKTVGEFRDKIVDGL